MIWGPWQNNHADCHCRTLVEQVQALVHLSAERGEGRVRKAERRGWDWLLKREEEKEQEEVEEGPREESYKD